MTTNAKRLDADARQASAKSLMTAAALATLRGDADAVALTEEALRVLRAAAGEGDAS